MGIPLALAAAAYFASKRSAPPLKLETDAALPSSPPPIPTAYPPPRQVSSSASVPAGPGETVSTSVTPAAAEERPSPSSSSNARRLVDKGRLSLRPASSTSATKQ